jgi:predicted nuclease of restriction endonuclease-like (RecB) superfamily
MKRTTRAAPKAPPLYARIRQILESARASAARSVNTTQVMSNWLIGREIVEEEQRGTRRAGYGEELLVGLAEKFRVDAVLGYSVQNLRYMRQFYLVYPELAPADQIRHAVRGESGKMAAPVGITPGRGSIRHAVRGELDATQTLPEILYAPRQISWQPGRLHPHLSWTHYRTLLRVDKSEARAFYEIEAIKDNWAARELERQINSLLYERLTLSRDKNGLMRLAVKGHEVQKSTDVFKDPVVMEFLGLPESPKLTETDLEQALIDNLQVFLLELGKGFAFVARQERLTLDGDHFYIDLVFYHTILKCFVIVELKTGKLMHQDLGQLQLYVNYYDRERCTEGDNPTLGLILCTDKNDTVVRYTLGPDQRKTIFASRYKLHLPTEAELKAELRREVRALSGRKVVKDFLTTAGRKWGKSV